MAGTILGMNNYYNLFSSPVSSFQANPITNLMYGSIASKAYSQTVAKKMQSNVSSYLTSLSRNTFDLKATAKPLTSKGTDSSFSQKAVTSSDNVAVTGTAKPNASNASYTINVSKIAVSQSNKGLALDSANKSSINEGVNTIKLKVGNTEKNISFTINEKDTNKSGLEKMANAINSAKVGVTANVTSDTKTGKSFISLTSDKTGTDNSFSIEEVTGNAVSSSGTNAVATQAQNAEYTLDGKQYTSQSNNIGVDNGKVQLTLNKAEGKDIKLTVGQDTKAIKSDIEDLVKSYNNMVNLANSNSSDFKGAEKLKDELTNVIKSKSTSLQDIGINQNDDGTLTVDDKKLESAISNNSSTVKNIFTGSNGIGDKLYSKAIEVSSAPTKYSSPQDLFGNSGSNYNNAFTANSSLARRNMYVGLIVDTLL